MSAGRDVFSEPVDLAMVAADDALLDALGRGAAVSDADETALLLAAWRADLSAPDSGGVLRQQVPDPLSSAVVDDAVGAGRARRRWGRFAVAAAVLALVGGGLAVGAANATPDSPLWPLAAAVNPERADILTADADIAQARQAISAGRYADAQRLVDKASVVVARVRDPQQSKRLTTELTDVRRALSAAGAITRDGAAPTPTPTAAPPPTLPSGAATTGSHPSTGTSGSATPAPLLSLPGGLLPTLPLPTLPGRPYQASPESGPGRSRGEILSG